MHGSEYETDSNDVMYVRVDRTRKLPITVLVRAMGYGTDAQITELLGDDERVMATIQKDSAKTQDEGLIEIYKRLRPGEPPTVESATSLIRSLFFEPKRYDLAKFGRFKFNKKLSLASRIAGHRSAERIVSPVTGEILAEEDEYIDRDKAEIIQNSGINSVYLNVEGKKVRVIGNGTVDLRAFVDFDVTDTGISEKVRFSVLKELMDEYQGKKELKQAIRGKRGSARSKTYHGGRYNSIRQLPHQSEL